VVRYDNRFFQLEPESRHYAPARGQVRVCEGRDGSIAIEYRSRSLPWQEIPPAARPSAQQGTPPSASGVTPARAAARIAKRKWVPPANPSADGQAARAHLLSGSGLRSALNAPPFGLRRAPLRPEPESNNNDKSNNHQTASEGTLLMS